MIVVSADSTDIFFNVAERGLYIPTKAGTFHPSGHKALIRQHGEGVKVLSVVKNSYKLVTHKEVYDALTPILSEHDVTVSTYHDADGAKAYIDVRFDKLTTSLAGSNVAFRVIFHNGYGGTSLGCIIGAINAFCTNGMILGDYETVYRRHTSGLDASVALDWLNAGMAKWDVGVERWHRWVKTASAGKPELDTAFSEMSTNETHQEMMRHRFNETYVPKYGFTRFALYQTLTDFASHYEDYKLRAVNNNSPHEREFTLLAKAERVMSRLAA
jgi:hypothetical protein